MFDQASHYVNIDLISYSYVSVLSNCTNKPVTTDPWRSKLNSIFARSFALKSTPSLILLAFCFKETNILT